METKKLLLSLSLAIGGCMVLPTEAWGQTTYTTREVKNSTSVVEMETMQVRMGDVVSTTEFKPLVSEMKVLVDEAVRETFQFDTKRVNMLGGSLENVQRWAAFQLAKKYKADVIVGATFDTYYNSLDNGAGSWVEIVGYPAKFTNWRTMSNEDLDWIVKLKAANKIQ